MDAGRLGPCLCLGEALAGIETTRASLNTPVGEDFARSVTITKRDQRYVSIERVGGCDRGGVVELAF